MTYAGKSRQRTNVPLRPQISQSAFIKELAGARFLSGVTATGSALKAVSGMNFSRSTDIIIVTDGFSFDSVEEESNQLRYSVFKFFAELRQIHSTLTAAEMVNVHVLYHA
ncbi:hypothetical protein OESDEN_01054 [Oesophagostomum dentatum]|uniref:VWFA domain-containing protein n=1 Tax=Oesophagostomum dentatum TaxID=61180 RepID=A0A0B1TN26_OESDE|nr:hypothetical protein OESDEN_01054 [Oesophagostomum dentatum]